MTTTFSGETRLEVWVEATVSLLQDDNLNVGKYDRLNVLLDIASPGKAHPIELKTFDELDEMYRKAGKKPVHTVAEWIFPGWIYQKEGIEGVYETYPEQVEPFLQAPPHPWGTYAHRMIKRRSPSDESTFNPLKKLIDKMSKYQRPDESTYHSCYEMGIPQGPVEIPLYEPSSDRNLLYGIPCLSHLSFQLFDGNVHLTAFYRSHHYRFKVPGNLLGLARLQAAVAREAGVGLGKLVVHSCRARVEDNAGGMPEFREFVTGLADEIGIDI